jgi:hypothetical protein
VKDKSNTREDSQVTLEDCKGRRKELEEYPYRSRSKMKLRLEERVFGVGKFFPNSCTCKIVLDEPKKYQI